MTTTRTFHLGDLVSVVTGRLVSPNLIGSVYDVCDYVTGQPHMTHQLPRACKTVTPWLLDQHPWLADIQVPDFDGVAREDAQRVVAEWLAGPVAQHGDTHEVTSMPPGMYVGREPIGELREMAPHVAIIPVVVDP